MPSVSDEQEKIATSNQKAYIQGRFDEGVRAGMELRHLAVQRARWEIKSVDPNEIYKRANELVRDQPIATQMQFFIECGFTRDLKCYQTEGAFTQELYTSGGKLNIHRFVDRQHV